MTHNKILSDRTYSILDQFAKISLTVKALQDFSLEQVDFQFSLNTYLARVSPYLKFFIKVSLWIFELGAVFKHGKVFTRLHPSQKDRYFKSWHHSATYFSYLLMRPLLVFVNTAYYSHDVVAESLGFHDHSSGQLVQELNPKGVLDCPEKDIEMEVDVCVIGSGAGGAVVAKELAQMGHEVVILEEGGYFGLSTFRGLSTLDRNSLIYRDAGLTTTIGIPMILLPTGKCVGGTTVINSGTCFRTPEDVFERWNRDYDIRYVNDHMMKPYFDRVEKNLNVQTADPIVLGNNNKLVSEVSQKLKWKGGALKRNAHFCEGKGECIFGCPTGAKQSMERTYLPQALKAGAKLYLHCRVEKLYKQYDRVNKIVALCHDPKTGRKKSKLTLYPKKVVVCAGTLQTPVLLKKSGIGLQSGELGENLSLHPTGKVVGIFHNKIKGHVGIPQGYGVEEFRQQGLMFESVFFPPWLLANSLHQAQETHREIMLSYEKVGIFGFLVHDQGRGRVLVGPSDRPMVFYSMGRKEKDLFVKGLKIVSRMLFEAGAHKLYPTVRTISQLTSAAQIEQLDSNQVRFRDLESAAFHPVGTCRMGSDPFASVIDENLKIHDMENVWVADGSIFPTSLGVNPQVSIMAFATRCSEAIHALG